LDQVLANERRGHRVLMLAPVLVHAHLAQHPRVGGPVPADVVAAIPRAQAVVQPAPGIAAEVGPAADEDDVAVEDALARLGLQVPFLRRAAPDEIPGVDGLDFRRQLRAHGGAYAVAADQEVGALAAAAGEMRDHARAVLVDTLEAVA